MKLRRVIMAGTAFLTALLVLDAAPTAEVSEPARRGIAPRLESAARRAAGAPGDDSARSSLRDSLRGGTGGEDGTARAGPRPAAPAPITVGGQGGNVF